MKKTHRTLLSILLAMALLASLPMTVLADEDPEPTHITESTQTNDQSGVIVDAGVTVSTNTGKDVTNNGTINTNEGTITNNGTEDGSTDSGTVDTNNGKIENNYGTVGKMDEQGNPVEGTGNNGIIETNNGTVISNNDGGTIEVNAGTVGKKTQDGSVVDGSGNSGTIETNEGTIFANNKTGTIGTNDGLVEFSGGEITTNNGIVNDNSPDGTVGTNNGEVLGNCGTVETNAINGIVYNKPAMDQGGNDITGKVNTNYGTVYEYDAETCSYVTTYGVQVQNTDGGAGTKLLQAAENTVVKLAEEFKRAGYKLVGYEDITPDGMDDHAASELSDTEFQAKRPSILSLIWKAIVKPAAPAAPAVSSTSSDDEPEAKPVKVAAVPSTVAAEDVKVGTVVRVKGQLFKIIEMDDGSITVVTMGTLSKKDMEDLMAFLARYLTPEQIELLLGSPELISQELADKLFGGNTNHIVFQAAKNLFA